MEEKEHRQGCPGDGENEETSPLYNSLLPQNHPGILWHIPLFYVNDFRSPYFLLANSFHSPHLTCFLLFFFFFFIVLFLLRLLDWLLPHLSFSIIFLFFYFFIVESFYIRLATPSRLRDCNFDQDN